jgi:hypothetical protein
MGPSGGDAVRGSEFSADDFDEAYPPGYELHYWHIARGEVIRDMVRSVCNAGATVLEIGPGRGHYVRLLRADGFNAYGCDLGVPRVHEEVKEFVFEKTDFARLDQGLREEVEAVLLLDVLEHIDNPVEFLASVLKSLPAVRSLIITVPARQELWSNYDEHYRHFRRYDIAKLYELAEKCRLSINKCAYFFHALYLPAWLMKKLGLNRSTAFAAPKALRLHKVLGYLFWLESKLLPGRSYGTSLACLCRVSQSKVKK